MNDNETIYQSITFAEQIMQICENEDIKNSSDFTFCTFVEQTIYYKLKNNRLYVPDERIAYSICFGLKLSFSESCYLLRLAGLSIMPRTAYDKYREILCKMLISGNTYIPDCNIKLQKYGFPELGSKCKRNIK